MIENCFEILFIISVIGILFKIIYQKRIVFKQIILILNLVLFVSLFSNNTNYEQYGGNKSKTKKSRKKKKRTKRELLLNQCGLPKDDMTNHCFNDSTHHTCCMLGPKARKYADESGNPIGQASLDAYEKATGKTIDRNSKTLTPWCTCTGSEVCSYYAKEFDDGTHLKFINNPKTQKAVKKPKSEAFYKNKFKIMSHRTPGIN